MARCKFLQLAVLLVLHSAYGDLDSNIFLNGEYKNSIDSHPFTSSFENSMSKNIFLEHAIFSRQAQGFSGPQYLPPTEYIKCGSGQQCVKKNVCVGGYFTNNPYGYIQNCEPSTDVCCTYRPPTTTTTTTTTTTQRPYVLCPSDSDCVLPNECSRGTINVPNYVKKPSTSRCYSPEGVCCRLPATTLTPSGYVLTVPEIPFPSPPAPPKYIPPAPPAPPKYIPPAPPAPPAPPKYIPPAPPAPPVYVPPKQQYTPPPPAPPKPPVYVPPKQQYIPPPPAPPKPPVYVPPKQQYIPPPPAPPKPPVYVPPRQQYTPPPPAPPKPQPPRYTPQPSQPPPVYKPPAYIPPAPQPPAPRPTPAPRPIKEYLPPVQPLVPSSSELVIRGEDILSEPIIPPRKPPVFSNDLTPFTPSKCSAALICTDVDYCTVQGVISDSPTNLTPQQSLFRVPLTDCTIEGSGAPGKCCRDANYVDPWPVNPSGQCAVRNRNTKPRGVTEEDTNFAEIPWQVMVVKESTKTLLCGGAIIGYGMVLTTASCVSGQNTKDVLVKAGEWQLGSDDEPLPFQLVRASEIQVHPGYDAASGQNNLAVILLEKNLQTAIHISPICISDKDPSPSENCIITGWGKDALKIHQEGAIMHQTVAETVSRSECGASKSQVCARTKYDACNVDYGSALACGTGTSYVLKGTFTTEDQCGNSVATFTKPDIKWINTAFNNNKRALALG